MRLLIVFQSTGAGRQGPCRWIRCEYVHVRSTKTSLFLTIHRHGPCLPDDTLALDQAKFLLWGVNYLDIVIIVIEVVVIIVV
ncbi:hypothetical protein, partial [Marinobacter sp.]|uniref:hypothetical protein n=1 Tax=Marinobacter sp. TaxID=50741 RepID=UPI003562312A